MYVLSIKKDAQSIVSNYRPISLLSTISKVFEPAVYKHVFFILKNVKTIFLMKISLVSCHMTLLSASCLTYITLFVKLFIAVKTFVLLFVI